MLVLWLFFSIFLSFGELLQSAWLDVARLNTHCINWVIPWKTQRLWSQQQTIKKKISFEIVTNEVSTSAPLIKSQIHNIQMKMDRHKFKRKKSAVLFIFLSGSLNLRPSNTKLSMKKMREPEKKVVKDERTNERIKRAFYEEHKRKKGENWRKI